MLEFREELLLMITVPIYAIVILAEIIYSYIHNKNYYSVRGVVSNTYLTILNMLLDLAIRGACLATLVFFYNYKIIQINFINNAFLYWMTLLLAQDFMYYWLHRVDHYCRFFWAVHVTHHSSEEFNLTVGFRSSVFQPLYRFIYFIPLTLLGFEPLDILFMHAATQIYGILIHTKSIGKLGFLEWIFSTPSHHRVHHASNVKYLDKNMGMFLIIWDRLFGTFEVEDETVVYGLTTNINSNNPLKIVFHEWNAILKDVLKVKGLKNKLCYIFCAPGWSHDGSTKTTSQFRKELKSNQNL